MIKERYKYKILLLLLSILLETAFSASTPTSPFLDLTVLSQSSINANFSAPSSDGGSAINSYKIEWDTDPGIQEVQAITTSTYTGPNEIQTIQTSAPNVNEVQIVNSYGTHIPEVQKVTVSSATGGYFFFGAGYVVDWRKRPVLGFCLCELSSQ